MSQHHDLTEPASGNSMPDGPTDSSRMTGSELLVVRTSLGMSRAELSRVLSVNENTVRRWESGKGLIPARLRDEISAIENAADEAVNSLVAELRSMAAPRVVLRREQEAKGEDRLDPAGYGSGWYRSVVGRAIREVPGTRVGTADEFADLDAQQITK
ncbi:helix-turn-helix domain-containing protein [Promicromonospora vindobonensis]|uniref:Helix-turn-helix domain-containing protein n=1 Tax=Promicromonospora vindobonensis TaxID=195748 RepID=A0ABW5VXN9_9MICO